jgi:hypothetical protein
MNGSKALRAKTTVFDWFYIGFAVSTVEAAPFPLVLSVAHSSELISANSKLVATRCD